MISYTKVIVPEKLKNFNLKVNETKTEEYEVGYLIRKTYMKTVHGQNANY